MSKERDKIYLTSDMPFAAYLAMRGYTLLGTIRTGQYNERGYERLDCALTNASIVTPEEMQLDVLSKSDEFNTERVRLGDGTLVSFKEFARMMRICAKALKTPIEKGEL